MGKMNILHLSDLHIPNTFDDSSILAYEIGEGLDRLDEIVNVVVVTGDIFYKPSEIKEVPKAIINKAYDFFDQLLNKINSINRTHNIEQLSREDFLFVPGNHDLYRDGTKNDIWSLYNKFLNKFYNNNLPPQYCREHMLIKPYPEKEVLFLGFNSNIDPKKKSQDMFTGHISKKQLQLADEFLKKGNGYPEYDIITLFHHPCYLYEETEVRNNEGIINNAIDVLKKLAQWDVKLVLHGHKHGTSQYIHRPIIGQKIYMFAADTIGKHGSNEHSGNIIKLGKNIRLDRIIARNNNNFSIEKLNIRDKYEEGLLDKVIRESESNGQLNGFDNVIQMISELYLSYKQLKLLLYNKGNSFILKNSLIYKLNPNYAYSESYEGITKNELLEIKNILSNSNEMSLTTKNSLLNSLVQKRHIAFALLADFFVDLYKEINKTRFVNHEYTQFDIGTSCYYVYFTLKSSAKEAEAYNELDNIMQEFQVRLYEIQDFLYCIKLNIKNIFLELQGDCINDKSYCDFDASVPRLIQLLTGSNIYYHDYSFVRELIQNSIDAISFRKEQDKKVEQDSKFVPQIHITIGYDLDNTLLTIKDTGIGMRREMIERYFTTLGRSFYKEYTGTKNIQYNSISNFGIGFLAVFKPCKKIIINTKHFAEEIHHTLEINSNQGHFTICSNPQTEFGVGTEIQCFLEQNVNCEEIINYIKEIMLDIKYDIIIIKADELGNHKITARAIRELENNKQENINVIFIPLNEDDENGSIDFQNMELEKAMKDYRHGILIRPESADKAGVDILSAGIKLQNARLEDVFGKYERYPQKYLKMKYTKVTMNFPPNWLNIDVSREKANGVCKSYIKDMIKFNEHIYNGLQYWVRQALKRDNLNISFFSDTLTLMKYFSTTEDRNNEPEKLNIEVRFEKGCIYFKFGDEKEILSHTWEIDYKFTGTEKKHVHKTVIDLFNEFLSHDEVSTIQQMLEVPGNLEKSRRILQKLGLGLERCEDKYLPIVLVLFLEEEWESRENDAVRKKLWELVVVTILNSCTVGDIGKESLFSIDYDNRKQIRLATKGKKLDQIIKDVARFYNAPSDIYKYDFMWKYIAEEIQKEYKFYFNDEKNKIPVTIKNEYLSLNRKTKNLYFSGDNPLMDCYAIAACYMGALLSIPEEKIMWPEDREPLIKYYWILEVGLQLVYIWRLAEYTESHKGICDSVPRKGEFKFPDGDKSVEMYAKLLASQEKKIFDVLCFAELLHWVDIYNKDIFNS